MQKNDINTLRDHLFDTLEKLSQRKISEDEAKAISQVAQVIINSAKVEVDYIRATEGTGTGFIQDTPLQPKGLSVRRGTES